jgi:hypothetical protein
MSEVILFLIVCLEKKRITKMFNFSGKLHKLLALQHKPQGSLKMCHRHTSTKLFKSRKVMHTTCMLLLFSVHDSSIF